MFRSPLIRFSAVAIVAALAMAACGDDGSPAAANNSTAGTAAAGSAGAELPAAKLSLVAYSTPQEAYEKIITAFNATPAGKNITFSKSFGASGDQSRAVASGLDADYVAFSLEPDVTRLVKANLVAPDWNKDANAGIYGTDVTSRDVLFSNKVTIPPSAQALLRSLRDETRATSGRKH